MINFFRVITIAAGLAIISLNASAQNDDEAISYRARGYRGNVAFTDQYLVWMGFDTSHGYMFNEHHYLGAGAGLFLAPIYDLPAFGHVFLDYHAYFKKKKSTPMAGIKAGYCFSIGSYAGNVFDKSFEIEPCVGWNWSLSSNRGLNLSLGASVFVYGENKAVAMPKVSFAFEF